jgi:hypothetical protein
MSNLGANLQLKNARSWSQGFLALTPSVKRAEEEETNISSPFLFLDFLVGL